MTTRSRRRDWRQATIAPDDRRPLLLNGETNHRTVIDPVWILYRRRAAKTHARGILEVGVGAIAQRQFGRGIEPMRETKQSVDIDDGAGLRSGIGRERIGRVAAIAAAVAE